jgi:5-methylthioadenosine/S-adenosylhomocysteine deaminase
LHAGRELCNPNRRRSRPSDPLRSLIFHAADRAVKDVYVAGRRIVADGKVTTLDHAGAAARLAEAQARMMAATPKRDYRGRSADEIAPLTLPLMS